MHLASLAHEKVQIFAIEYHTLFIDTCSHLPSLTSNQNRPTNINDYIGNHFSNLNMIFSEGKVFAKFI